MQPTEQMVTDTETALSHWWCGTKFSDILEGGTEYTEDAVRGALLFDQSEEDTIKLLTLWRGYLDASANEETQPSVEDFILATYVVQQEE